MGLFLHILLFPGGEQSACEAALRQAADLPELDIHLDQCRWHGFPKGPAALLNDGCCGYESLAEELSGTAPGPVMVLYMYDGDYWGYLFYQNGAALDQFSSLPDYFGEGSPPDCPGNAELLAKLFGVPADSIAPYVRPWREEAMGGFARQGDQFEIGDCWQLADFLEALGFSYDQLCPPELEREWVDRREFCVKESNFGANERNYTKNSVDLEWELTPGDEAAPIVQVPRQQETAPIDSTEELPNALTSQTYALSRAEEVLDVAPEAVELVRSMDCAHAIPLLTAAIQANPDRAGLYVLRSFCWNQLEGRMSGLSRKPDMDRDMTRLLELEPDNVMALRARCPTAGTTSRYRRHIEDLTRLMELDPEYQDAYQVSLAYRRHWVGDDMGARADLQAVLDRGGPWSVDLVYLCGELGLPGF